MRTLPRFMTSLLLSVLFTQSLPSQWYQQSFPSSEYLWRVQFVDTSTGWVFGHNYIYLTTDGGATWVAQDSGWGGGEMFCAKDTETAFYANWYGTPAQFQGLRRTTNGGTNWVTIDTTAFFYLDMEFVTDQVGYVAGSVPPDYAPAIRKTTDGGATWATTWVDSTQEFEFEGVSFIDESTGWAITYRGVIFKTTNGGQIWILQDTLETGPPGWQPFRDIQFVSADSGWSVGGIAGNSLIARTTDGGASWGYFDATLLQGGSLREVTFLDNENGWAVGYSGYGPLRTSDGGLTWGAQILSPPYFGGFESMSIVNASLSWAVGASGTVYKTTNGGVVWVGTGMQLPVTVRLDQNYPNPFNPGTTISYTLPKSTRTTLRVFNLLGEEVATLVDAEEGAGPHTVNWDGSNLPSGMYVARLQTPAEYKIIKLLLIR